MNIDIDNLANPAEVTHKINVAFDDDGKPSAGFVVVGENSPQYQAIRRSLTATAVQKSALKKEIIDAKTPEGADKVAEVSDANRTKVAMACTVDWFGFTSNGKPAEFSREALAKLLEKLPAWRDRIAAAVETDAFFAK